MISHIQFGVMIFWYSTFHYYELALDRHDLQLTSELDLTSSDSSEAARMFLVRPYQLNFLFLGFGGSLFS